MGNREIKFRAWYGHESRWLCGFDSTTGEGGIHILGETIGLQGGFVGEVGIDEKLNTVIAEQFTGRKDKIEKEIYEGDLIKAFDAPRVFEVIWSAENCQYEIQNQALRGGNLALGDLNLALWEVCGNIHENPELLEVKNV